jgi:hypothetical protein
VFRSGASGGALPKRIIRKVAMPAMMNWDDQLLAALQPAWCCLVTLE